MSLTTIQDEVILNPNDKIKTVFEYEPTKDHTQMAGFYIDVSRDVKIEFFADEVHIASYDLCARESTVQAPILPLFFSEQLKIVAHKEHTFPMAIQFRIELLIEEATSKPIRAIKGKALKDKPRKGMSRLEAVLKEIKK